MCGLECRLVWGCGQGPPPETPPRQPQAAHPERGTPPPACTTRTRISVHDTTKSYAPGTRRHQDNCNALRQGHPSAPSPLEKAQCVLLPCATHGRRHQNPPGTDARMTAMFSVCTCCIRYPWPRAHGARVPRRRSSSAKAAAAPARAPALVHAAAAAACCGCLAMFVFLLLLG